MGQYYYVANLDKKQYIHPHRFGDGLKLLEFGSSGQGTMTGLAILLASGNGRGGGDLRSEHPIIGSWAGDRIVITGDYADAGLFLTEAEVAAHEKGSNLYNVANESREWTDISHQVLEALVDDDYLAESLAEAIGPSSWCWDREGGAMPAKARRLLVAADKRNKARPAA